MKKIFTSLMMLASATVSAQGYPAKPIHFVVGFPAGSSIDNISRTVLDEIRNRTGATIIVENKPGALGSIGADAVAKSAPDGYTLMPSSSATNSSGPHLMQSLKKLDLDNNLTHIGRMVKFDIAVVTNASTFADAKSLIDRARAKPGDLTYGYGSGTG